MLFLKDIKSIVAKNISQLRQEKGMTQIELAQKLNYSDKAVSKWERGESLPDIGILVEVAKLFGVTLDYLVKEEHKEKVFKGPRKRKYNRYLILGISLLLVLFVALSIFVIISVISSKYYKYQWLVFVYAVPVSMIVWLVMSTVWFRSKYNYIAISVLMWSGLASIHLSCLPFEENTWLMYLLGIPGQIAIVMWSKIKLKSKEKTE